MTVQILIAGFGGQGILFLGKLLAYKALIEGRELSWLPSYGPEMRGGTASCSVTISTEPVGSPIITNPDILIAMNLPSLDRYEGSVRPGGMIFTDSSLIERPVARTDVKAFAVPATRMAVEMGAPNLANMIILGNLMKQCPELVPYENVGEALAKVVSAKHPEMAEVNLRAIKTGFEL